MLYVDRMTSLVSNTDCNDTINIRILEYQNNIKKSNIRVSPFSPEGRRQWPWECTPAWREPWRWCSATSTCPDMDQEQHGTTEEEKTQRDSVSLCTQSNIQKSGKTGFQEYKIRNDVLTEYSRTSFYMQYSAFLNRNLYDGNALCLSTTLVHFKK